MARDPVKSKFPMTFEALGQSQGFVLYCTRIHGHYSDPALLELKGLADRAYVYLDKVFHRFLKIIKYKNNCTVLQKTMILRVNCFCRSTLEF